MIRLNGFLVALVALVCSAQAANAETPDLLGMWTAEVRPLLKGGGEAVTGRRHVALVFEKQDGSILWGYKGWMALDRQKSNVAGEDLLEAKQPFIGAFDRDEQNIRIVESADDGFMFGTVIGPDELQVTYKYPHAVVWSAVFRRSSD